MRRIGAISKALPALAGDDGVRADIRRAAVVFLHATFEDFVRSNRPNPTKRWTFDNKHVLAKALRDMGAGPEGFDELMAALDRLAARRQQIVHYADLGEIEVEAAAPWTIGDDVRLLDWHLAVLSFVHRLRKATGAVSAVEDRAGRGCVNARAKVHEFVDMVASLPVGLPPDQLRQRVEAAKRALHDAQEAMRLGVEMFLDAEGNLKRCVEAALLRPGLAAR